MKIKSIRPLNKDERFGIEKALRFYIENHKIHFVQKVILEEMLDVLMWADMEKE